ncbi:MAG: glycoside hydrolase family 130 protein [Phycisphaerae bacterium]
MDGNPGQDVIRRWVDNPLIALEDLPFACSDILNAAVVPFAGEYIMLVTVEALEGQCRIYPARGRDGKHFTVAEKPLMTSAHAGCFRQHESFGIRDPRITPMDETYYIAYVADGDHGLRLGLAKTDDFQSVERIGFVAQVDTKNGMLFPMKYNGQYAMLTRPAEGASIWIQYSDDLRFWSGGEVVMTPRYGFWDANMIGAAAPPIEIDRGWLLIYYGEKHTSAGPLVRLGAAILDKANPARIISRSNIPILSPREPYERIGDVPNVVFSCGAILDEDDMLNVYYGASDSCICLGQAPLADVIEVCKDSEQQEY